MTEKEKRQEGLDKSGSDLQKRNARFDQERADSLDHIKQSGKGDGDNALPKPAGSELAKP
jgi:hypothetical protein